IGIAIFGTDLYISEILANKISKFSLNTLSVEEFLLKNTVEVYPNPTSDYFQISGLIDIENYSIYNNLGAKIKTGKISNQEKIDIQNLAN
ncbi:T9SS type A sorting domain-containing protein, partial [Pseudoalteromonas sp. CR1]|nr:T9SS type A sorting domain-containing protein [Pseudoalteromonas sp. CR1]